MSWRFPLFIQCIIGTILAIGSIYMPESPRCVPSHPLSSFIHIISDTHVFPHSWLIDTGDEIAGMHVIADLHGGDPTDPVAVAEFDEIKEKVMEEVRLFLVRSKLGLMWGDWCM
jgi:hypothetical protein